MKPGRRQIQRRLCRFLVLARSGGRLPHALRLGCASGRPQMQRQLPARIDKVRIHLDGALEQRDDVGLAAFGRHREHQRLRDQFIRRFAAFDDLPEDGQGLL